MKLNDYKLNNWKDLMIKDMISFGQIKVLLLDIDRGVMPPIEGRKNLVATDLDDNIIWIADIPKSYPMFGSFQQIIKIDNEKIIAYCGSIRCIINAVDGKILEEKFTK